MSSQVPLRHEYVSSSIDVGRTNKAIVEAIRSLAQTLMSRIMQLSSRKDFVDLMISELSSSDLEPYARMVVFVGGGSEQTRDSYYKEIVKRILQMPGPITSDPRLLKFVPFLRNLVRPFDVTVSDDFNLSAGRELIDAQHRKDAGAQIQSLRLYDPLFQQTWTIDPAGKDALAIRNELASIRGQPALTWEELTRGPKQPEIVGALLSDQVESFLTVIGTAVDSFVDTMMFTRDLKPAMCAICSRPLDKPLYVLGCAHVYHKGCWDAYEARHKGVEAGCPKCDYKVRPKASTASMVQIAQYVPGAQLPARPARPEPLLGKRGRDDLDEKDIIEGMSRMGL